MRIDNFGEFIKNRYDQEEHITATHNKFNWTYIPFKNYTLLLAHNQTKDIYFGFYPSVNNDILTVEATVDMILTEFNYLRLRNSIFLPYISFVCANISPKYSTLLNLLQDQQVRYEINENISFKSKDLKIIKCYFWE